MNEAKLLLTIGLVTDVHYADAFPRANRYYQESLTKLEEAACVLREEKVDIAVELGDLIDARRKPDLVQEREYLKRIGGTAKASFASLEGYIGASVFVEGLKKAGKTPTRESFIDALDKIGTIDLKGFRVKYSPTDHSGSNFVELTVLGAGGLYKR